MPMRQLHRTLKRAVRLQNMSIITCEQLLQMDRDGYQEIRRAATRARNNGEAAFACEQCGFPVYAPLEPTKKLPFWRHHKGGPRSCIWWTGDPRSIDAVAASQFDGAQESPLHHRIKNVVAELLESDSNTKGGSIAVEKYVIFEGDRRRPDVSATYAEKPIAVEIQLATTQIPIIVAREDFYSREGRHLIWMTWNFLPVERANMPSTFEDIFYSHNKNIFSLDDEVVAKSRESRMFFVRAFWEHGSGWNSKILALHELQWPSSGLPFAVAPPPPWHLDFRNRWQVAAAKTRMPWSVKEEFLNELTIRLNDPNLTSKFLDEMDVEALLNAIMSFVTRYPVGSAQSNLTELINTFLSSEHRFRYARVIRRVIIETSGDEFLKRKSVADKFTNAMKSPQEDPNSKLGKIALLLFPDLFQKRSQKIES
jgi:hypothetical protein